MTWKPRNYKGSIHYDPRDELRARARAAEKAHDSHLAISVELALALADLHECDASTVTTGDEDGPLPEPLTIFCRLPRDHAEYGQPMHYNGYTHWK